MKKITALVLAIIMTAAFTGCAPKEEPAAIEEPQATPEPEPQEVDLKTIKARKRRIH